MATQINSKITSYRIVSKEEFQAGQEALKPLPDVLHEGVARPEILFGSTYKIKTPQSDHALYITINDMILNFDSEYEERRPFEIFVNSKNMEHYQWVLALTRVISATFRKGGEVNFLVEELKAVFDPKGGYFKKGGVFMPSLVAEIGCVLEAHLKSLGKISAEPMPEYQKDFIAAKRAEFEALNEIVTEDAVYPEKATMCYACNTKALVLLDGCECCLSCGNSKCQ